MRGTAAAVALSAVLALAACSGGTGRAPRPRRGGVLRLAVTDLGSLDPAQASTPAEQLVATALFRTLTSIDPATLGAVPSLASSWRVSSGQRQWDFTLRADDRFANGRTVTADDVVYTFNRIARKGSSSPVADLLSPVNGFAAYNVEGSTPVLAGVSAPTATDVRLVLDHPLADLPLVLTNPAFGVVPKEAGEAVPSSAGRSASPAFGDEPVGSGPFVLATRRDSELSLVPTPGSPALVDRIDVTTFPDAAAAYQAFVAKRADWAPVPPDQAAAADARFGQGGDRLLAAELFYGFNLRDPVFADVRFRQAIVAAVDRSAIASRVYRSTVRPFSGLVPSGLAGHQADPCGAPCRYDPGGARTLVREVFGSSPPTIGIDFEQGPTQAAVAGLIRDDLRAVGVTATLRPKPLGDYQSLALGGHGQLFRLGWVAAYPSADAFLAPLFGTGSTTNLTGFSDAAVDRLLASARGEPDQAKRVAVEQDAERQILAKAPILPLVQFEEHSVIASRVRGLVINPLGYFDPSTVWIK